MAGTRKTSPWVYVGIGCGVAILLGVLVVVGGGFMVYRWGKRVESELKDPVAREARVLEILGSERIPEGYYAMMGLGIPLVMEMAMLTDVPPQPGDREPTEDIRERGFLYFKMSPILSGGQERQKLEDYLEGRSDDADFLRHGSISFERGEAVAHGDIALPGARQVRYVTHRGSLARGGSGGGAGLTSMVHIECPGDSRLRIAMWFGPDPDPGAEADAARLAGSVADPEELARFLGHFRLCGPAAAAESG